MKYTHDIIILGGGAGGLTVAAGSAQLGLKTALVELKHLGGDCLHHGCVPSKTLIHTATQLASLRNISDIGLNVPEVETQNIKKIMEHVRSVVENIAVHDSYERFTELGAEVFFARPQFTSPHEILLQNDADTRTISAARIVIATGSSPRPLPIHGLAETGYLTNVDIFSISKKPRELAIIGAGPIGIEMAQAFSRLGCTVTVLEAAPRILIHEDDDVAAFMHKELENEGITIATGVSITSVEQAKSKKIIKLEDNKSISCHEILVAAGRMGNVSLLSLEQAGVQTKNSFIPTDSRLRSSLPHILAVGDVNGRHLFTHVAGAEGAVAVRRLALGIGGTMNYHNIPRVTYCDPEIAVIGITETEAAQQGIFYKVHIQDMHTVDRAHAENSTRGFLKLLLSKSDRIIGAQIVAKNGGELLSPLLYAVRQGWKISALRTMYPYPVMSEIMAKAASSYLSPKLFNPRVRRILRLFRRYRGRKD